MRRAILLFFFFLGDCTGNNIKQMYKLLGFMTMWALILRVCFSWILKELQYVFPKFHWSCNTKPQFQLWVARNIDMPPDTKKKGIYFFLVLFFCQVIGELISPVMIKDVPWCTFFFYLSITQQFAYQRHEV